MQKFLPQFFSAFSKLKINFGRFFKKDDTDI